MIPHRVLRQGGVQERVESRQLVRGQFGQGHPQVIGNGAFGVEGTPKREFMKRIRIGKRLGHRDECREASRKGRYLAQGGLG